MDPALEPTKDELTFFLFIIILGGVRYGFGSKG
jgi:hypothetical protein